MFRGKEIENSGVGQSRKGWRAALRLAAALGMVLAMVCAAGPAAARDDDDDEGYEEAPPGGGAPIPPPYVQPLEGFEWRAGPRYSQWMSNWHERGYVTRGWALETYNPEYVNPTSWPLYMQGCQTKGDFDYDLDPTSVPKPTTKYKWEWNGNVKAFSEDCNTTLTFPAEGNYYVTMTIKKEGQPAKSWTYPVQVKDFLVVVLGDSAASGEGAPDDPAKLYIGPTARADWIDNRCHRSQYAGGAQAAKILEDMDPKTSVTFLSFACSGATLDRVQWFGDGTLDPYEEYYNVPRGVGITDVYVGIEPPGEHYLPAQTDQLWTALTNDGKHEPRRIDALIVAGGINDAGFARLATVCAIFNDCPNEWVGHYPYEKRLWKAFQDDVATVPSGWVKLSQQLEELGIEADRKLALEYPSFFTDDDGSMCLHVFDDLPWWLLPLPIPFGTGWFWDEIDYADANWAPMLNDAVFQGARDADFTYVGGIDAAFRKHGWCANDRYINTSTDAGKIQGDEHGVTGFFANVSATGTAHPNAKGYGIYANLILDHLPNLVDNIAPVGVGDKMWASPPLKSWLNVLDNDYDVDADDTLTVRLIDAPAHGTLDLSSDGWAYYKPNGGYVGADEFRYEVTDGVNARFVDVDIVVEPLTVVPAKVGFGLTEPITGMLGDNGFIGPYTVVLDAELPTDRGFVRPIPDEDTVVFTAPTAPRRRGLKLPYTVYSETIDRTSPDYGRFMRGVIKLRVLRRIR